MVFKKHQNGLVGRVTHKVGGIISYIPRDPIPLSEDRLGCRITSKNRKVFRFHAPILSFNDPGFVGQDNYFLREFEDRFPTGKIISTLPSSGLFSVLHDDPELQEMV